ncbi:MAG: DUF3047 domain-containing protein [Betaproteobacteria bacterium]|nr:DUF3047 domain-containing protein [Betaproteobacteria bacterium]
MNTNGARIVLCAVLFLAAGCAGLPQQRERAYTSIAPFSRAEPGQRFPEGWHPWTLSRFKRLTEYRLVRGDDGKVVVRAEAENSASGLIKNLDVDPAKSPWLSWRWKVPDLIDNADNTRRDAEDSPVRIVVAFDGDLDALDFEEKAIAQRVKLLTGRDMPYATLMYIWENRKPVGEIIPSAHTTRVKMLVSESGESREGQWLMFSRNVAEDFRRAFGEKPGRIRSIGIMTDTDNTGEKTRAYYGDIKFSASQPTDGGFNLNKEAK